MTDREQSAERQDGKRVGPVGDVRPEGGDAPPRTPGGLPQEDVEDRPVVGTVTPEDYPEDQRARG